MAESREEEFVERVQALFPRIMRHLDLEEEQELTGLDVRPSQMSALIALAQRNPQTMGALAWEMRLTESAATRLVDRLVAMNLVRRERDRQDRRLVRVRLSSYGRQLVDLVLNRRHERFSRIAQRMTPADRDALLQGLASLIDVFEALAEEARQREEAAQVDPADSSPL
jgi:DNA-binding MarR family transcriptional regulator